MILRGTLTRLQVESMPKPKKFCSTEYSVNFQEYKVTTSETVIINYLKSKGFVVGL